MKSPENKTKSVSRFGDRLSSDVVVRIRTQEGRDEWLYCHSHILIEKSKYFADRLSENWPTCQILDSRNCVEVYCEEFDFNYYINVVRVLYTDLDETVDDMWHGVRNTLGVLRVSVKLGCEKIVKSCVNYLEAVPWEEAEEEEILRIIPGMGFQVEPILARLKPVNPTAIAAIFLSAIRFATSSPPSHLNVLKSSAQEQLEYMLTEDDDAPLLIVDDEIKSEVKNCVMGLQTRFDNLLQSFICKPREYSTEESKFQLLEFYLSDLSWACHILAKLEIMREFTKKWIDESENIIKIIEQSSIYEKNLIIKLKVVEVASKVLEAIGYGTVIFPPAKRIHMVKTWLPFVRVLKASVNTVTTIEEDGDLANKFDGEIWKSLEAAFVSIITGLPSDVQAEILTEWLGDEHIRYPDLTEAFEVWCYRSKVAKKRLGILGNENG